jgi:hypothetical protein
VTAPVIHVAAAVVLDADGHMLVVRKRGTAMFMQPGGKLMAAEIDDIAWIDPCDPGGVPLAPLTLRLSADHCGERAPTADS